MGPRESLMLKSAWCLESNETKRDLGEGCIGTYGYVPILMWEALENGLIW